MTLTGLKRTFAWSLLLCFLIVLAGCASNPNPKERVLTSARSATATNNPAPSAVDGVAFLRVGDPLSIAFADVPPLVMQEQRLRIPDSGIITLPYNVHVQAAGKTISQLEKDIRDAYVPSLFVQLTAIARTEERAFYVDGEVRQPGRQIYAGQMTVMRAIGTAGGFTDFANRKKVELRRENGQKFLVNYNKALEDPALDLPVYPNDHIIVKKTIF